MGDNLTQRDVETLQELERAVANNQRYGWGDNATPMDCGGSNGSHHSYTLGKLAKKGLALKKRRGGWERGSYFYSITEAGVAELRARELLPTYRAHATPISDATQRAEPATSKENEDG